MQLGSPIEAVSAAIYHAAHIAFPDVHYKNRDWAALEGMSFEERKKMNINDYPMVDCVRRPQVEEVQVTAMFPQLWGSTALGFGGLGGAAMTPAYTVVLTGPGNVLGVYWAGRLAYTIARDTATEAQLANFTEDLARNITASVKDAKDRYGAVSERHERSEKKTKSKVKGAK